MTKRRERERTIEKVLWAHRGLGHAHEKVSIIHVSLGRTSGPSRPSVGYLDRTRSSVSCPTTLIVQDKSIDEKVKVDRQCERISEIVT